MPDLLTVAEALRLIELRAAVLPSQQVDLADALGMTLAAGVASDVDSPPHDKAMMDGYAVRVEDGVAARRVIEEVFAGDVPRLGLSAGMATRIMTGAPMPAGGDAVVPVERTQLSGDTVTFADFQPTSGKHVMPRGEAIRAGDGVLEAGTRIGPAQVALLAEVGCAQPTVTRRPRVAYLPTGAELVSAAERPGPGQIRNSNGPMLHAAIEQMGAAPLDLGVATDDEAALREAILRGRDADVLLLSGGVSAGDKDLAPGVLAELGVERVFHKVAVKPGKPIWFGVWPDESKTTFVFGLPGNPVSSFVCFQLFARPLIAALSGRGFTGLSDRVAALEECLTHRGGRETYLPAVLDSTGSTVRLVAWRGSADVRGLAAANALVRLPVVPLELAAGDSVPVLVLPAG